MKPEVLSLLTWKDIREIMKNSDVLYNELFFPTERDYYTYILERLKDTNIDERVERYIYLTRKAEQATGYKATRRKDYWSVLTRAFVSRQLWNEGMSYMDIARISKRNHATIMNQVRIIDDMLTWPKMYADELSKYNTFLNSLENAEQDGEQDASGHGCMVPGDVPGDRAADGTRSEG